MDHAVLETDRHRYVVVSHLAEGGMGAIYLGRRVSTEHGRPSSGRAGADVVLKKLLPEHTEDPKLIEMFLREARLSAGLDHPNIVRTLDLVNAGSDYFIVMEYVRGGDLRSLLRRARRRGARLSVASALFIVAEVLRALDYAHRKRTSDGRPLGLIHRDVSPSNILLGSEGQVKLTDFGIAKATTQGSVVFKVKGKVGYMAPEQARGEPVDLRADLFAAGVVLYELLVGERLFVGNVLASPAAIFAQPVRPPSRKRPEVDPELDHLVLRALSLDPSGRFVSAQEMRTAVLRAAAYAGLALDAAALSADLHRACGADPNTWRNLDLATPQPASGAPGAVPGAVIDGTAAIARNDGTGVIDYDEEDEEEEERHGSRPGILPSKELTSIAHFIDDAPGVPNDNDSDSDPELELRATRIAADPFLSRERAPEPSDEFALEDSAIRTRVQTGDALLSRGAASRSSGVAPSAASSSSHSARLAASRSAPHATTPPTGQRAHFEPPVPRASPPPPNQEDPSDPRVASPLVLAAAEPTRISAPHPLSSAPEQVRGPMRDYDDPHGEPTRRPVSPASLAGLERSLNGRPGVKIVVGLLFLAVLVALGIGLGLLLSGEPPPPEPPRGEAPLPPDRAR